MACNRLQTFVVPLQPEGLHCSRVERPCPTTLSNSLFLCFLLLLWLIPVRFHAAYGDSLSLSNERDVEEIRVIDMRIFLRTHNFENIIAKAEPS